jgi:hypothetical protein
VAETASLLIVSAYDFLPQNKESTAVPRYAYSVVGAEHVLVISSETE